MFNFNDYIRKFQRLHVDRSKGIAPHKPILLISVFDEMDAGRITENRICITPELVATFKENWFNLVDSRIFQPKFALPFYHLKTDKFWHLIKFPGQEIALTSSNSIRSFTALKISVDYAQFDEDLFLYAIEPKNRVLFRTVLLETYFPIDKEKYAREKAGQNNYIVEIEEKLLTESPDQYRAEIANADEEEIYVRGGIFKKLVPRIYNYTCSISSLRINSAIGAQMIDACHIIPFSESHDDTISNGISLCPNLHRAFDRGLISIDDEYRVLVSNNFVENTTEYSLKQLAGRKIVLPQQENQLPSRKGIALHRERWNFV